MKRVLVVLLALVMGAGLAVAADQAPPKWAAYVEGWAILYDETGDSFLSPSWAGDAAKGQFTDLTFSYAEAAMGFSFVSEFDSTGWGASLRNMSGWFQVLPMLKLTAGKIRDGSYRPTSYVEGTSVVTRIANAEWGVLAQVMPVKALSLGAFVLFPEEVGDVYPYNTADYVDRLGFGASYAVDGIGTFYLNYRTINNQLGFSAKVTAMKALPMLFAYALNFSYPTSTHYGLFSAQYAAGALTASLDVKVQYDTAFKYGDELSVAYKVAPYTVGLNGGYGNMAFATGGVGPGLFVYPWVSVAVGSASSLKLGFILDTDGDGAGSDALAWSIPLRYVISF